MPNSFQTAVQQDQAPAIAGDFAGNNPTAVTLSIPGGLVADTAGVTVGLFAWQASTGKVLNSGSGVPSGFVGRAGNMQLITTFLAEYGGSIPVGLPVTLYTAGDFWATANTNAAVVGQKVFASLTTGATQTGAAGATISGFIETPWKVASAASTGELFKMTTWA